MDMDITDGLGKYTSNLLRLRRIFQLFNGMLLAFYVAQTNPEQLDVFGDGFTRPRFHVSPSRL